MLLLSFMPASSYGADECVVFLHGLARTSNSMQKIATAFEQKGYRVANIDYPSREHPIEELAPMAIKDGLAGCSEASTVHFVAHSLGGILVRYYLENESIPELGRVVMIAPPNQGSEVVDDYRNVPGFAGFNGPAGLQLGTDDDGIVSELGPVNFELGVIAGTASVNLILSQSLPNPDDGKVSVESTKVEGMSDFVQVRRSHPFIMRADEVIDYAIRFVQQGAFAETSANDGDSEGS